MSLHSFPFIKYPLFSHVCHAKYNKENILDFSQMGRIGWLDLDKAKEDSLALQLKTDELA